jgi:hypothetical protein
MGARSKVRRIDFYPDDWIAGTVGLRMQEQGVDWAACALIYSRGGPIEREHLRQICVGDARVFDRALARLIEIGKLVQFGHLLGNNRCASELERARSRIGANEETKRKSDSDDSQNNDLENDHSRARATPPSAKHIAKADGSESLPPARERSPSGAAPRARGNGTAGAQTKPGASGSNSPKGPPPPLPPEQRAMLDQVGASEGVH